MDKTDNWQEQQVQSSGVANYKENLRSSMYSENFPSEIDLLIFFESEPFLKDSSYGMCFGYKYGKELTLNFYINVTIKDVTIILKKNDITIVNISILNFENVSIDGDRIIIIPSDNSYSYLVTLKPNILIESQRNNFN